jgi:hypothetical protein
MSRSPDHWQQMKGIREKLNPEDRRQKALEDIADELVRLREAVQEIPYQLKMHFPAPR